MAHLVETMFYRGEVPWHGLGKSVKGKPTCREAIIHAGADWEVDKVRGLVYNPYADTGGDPHMPLDAWAIIRKTDGAILGTVGEDYRPLQNAEAFDFFDPFIKNGDAVLETAGVLKGGKIVWILAQLTSAEEDVVTGDPIRRYHLLVNSHDGSKAINNGETTVRVVCFNTLTAAMRSGLTNLSRIIHRGDVVAKLKALQLDLAENTEMFKRTAAAWRMMAGKPISHYQAHDYFRRVFEVEDTAEDSRAVKNTFRLWTYSPATAAVPPRTVWGAYNAVTEFTSHGRMANPEKRLNSLWFGDSAKVNARAFELAVSM